MQSNVGTCSCCWSLPACRQQRLKTVWLQMPEFAMLHTLSASREPITSLRFNARGDWLALGCAALVRSPVLAWYTARCNEVLALQTSALQRVHNLLATAAHA